MAKSQFRNGAEIETLTSGEMNGLLDNYQRNWFLEMARGLKPMRISPMSGTVANDAIALPATGSGQNAQGPAAGFVWAVRRITVSGLATGDTVQVYRNTTDGYNL